MSLATNPFDQAARSTFDAFEATPPAHAWASISAQLPERPKRRAAFWWWAGVGVCALALTAFWVVAPTTSPPNQAVASVAASAVLPLGQSPTPLGQSTPAQTALTQASAHQALSEDVDAEDETLASSTSTSAQASRPHVSPAASSQLPPPTASSVAPRPNENASLILSGDLEPAPSVTQEQIATPRFAETDAARELLGGSVALAPVLSLPSSLPSVALLPFSRKPMVLSGPIPCEDFRSRGTWRLGLRAFAGAGPTDRAWGTGQESLAGYLALRDSVEDVQLSLRAGLRGSFAHSSGFTVRVGLDYQMYRSEMTFAGNTIIDTLLSNVLGPTGNLIRVDTTISVTSLQQTVYNRHQTATLVAGLGYRRWFGRVAPYVFAEAGYEFLLNTRGAYPHSNPGETITLPDDRAWIKEQPGLRLSGTIGLDFALTDRLYVGPSVSFLRHGGLRGKGDPLDYTQTTVTGSLNVGFEF